MTISDDQIRELRAYADHTADNQLASKCAMALAPTKGRATSVDLARSHCEIAYDRAAQTPEWAARHLPYGAFRIAEMIASFLLEEAFKYAHLKEVHDTLVEAATRIRTADWIRHEESKR